MQLTAIDIPNLSAVTDMNSAFEGATNFTGHPSMSGWDTSNVIRMNSTFRYATNFDAPIGNRITSNVIDMRLMFSDASKFNQNIGGWDTSNVAYISHMFYGASSFNQNISSWKTNKITSFLCLFDSATSFNNGDVPGWNNNPLTWDTSNVSSLDRTFSSATSFNSPVNSWDTSNVVNMRRTFPSASSFNQPLDNWDTSKVTTMREMFRGASNFNQNLNSWNTSSWTDMSNMFWNATAFNNGQSAWESTAPLNWNTENVTDMSYMFYYASSFNQPIGAWNTSNVTSMTYMFGGTLFNQDISSWDTKNVTNMSNMFRQNEVFNQPIGGRNTSKVTDMNRMFYYSKKFNQPIGNWDTSKVTTTRQMFEQAESFNQPIGGRNMWKVNDMSYMFGNAISFNQPIGNWDTSKVTNMMYMFNSANMFNQDIGSWNIGNVARISYFLNDTSMQPDNYDKLLSGRSQQIVKPNLYLDAVGVYYCNAKPARDILTSAPNNWRINDAGWACPPSNITLSNTWVDEWTTYVGQFSGDDPNWPLIFTLVAWAWDDDNTQFTLSNSGVLAFFTAPDFENPTDLGDIAGNNTYSIRVQAKNNKNLTTQEVFIITVIDVDDFPPEISITAPTKASSGVITDTVITVSDRFSIESISVDWSTTATSDFMCDQWIPYINPTPLTGQHGVVNCTLKIKSSGKLVVTAQDMSWNIATVFEDGYTINTNWPQLTVFNVGTESPYSLTWPQVNFDVLDPSTVVKYELIYSGVSGITKWIYTTWSAYVTWGEVVLELDPNEEQHTITINVYDWVGNVTTRQIVFPPIVTFNAPTMVSSWTITDTTVTITVPVSGDRIGEIQVSWTISWVTLGDCVGPSWGVSWEYITNVTCKINNISQTGVVIVKAKNMTNGAVGQNSQKYFIETNAPTISIFPTKKASNQAITGTAEILDDVDIDVSNVSLTTNPAGQLGDRNCVQTDGKRVDCSWTLSWSMLSGASLTVSARDKAGNLSTKTETWFIIDTVPPVVTLNSTGVVNSQNQWSYSLNGTCSIDDGDVSMIVEINGYKFSSSCTASWTWNLVLDLSIPTMFPDWTIPLKISQTDALWNSTTISDSLLKDTKWPDLTVSLSDWAYLNQQLNLISGTSESWSIVSISMFSGTQILTGKVDVNWNWNINITPAFDEGTHEIVISAKDEYGNKSSDYNINFTIDMTKPVLTLSGSATVNLFVGDSFIDEGAIRTDNIDWTGITYSLDVVDTWQAWIYELGYDYSDQAGNTALTIKRTVVVNNSNVPVNTWYYKWRYVRHNLNEQQDEFSELIDDENTISDPEWIDAYKRAYKNGITTLYPISKARLNDPITRSELAKMMSVYTTKYGRRAQLTWKEWCDGYTDIDTVNNELRDYIKMSCELEIMWLQSDWKTPLQEFRPNDYVSRAEFSTVFSRILEGNKYDNNKDDARWEDHLNYLHDRLIIKKPDPTITELRAWILLIMYRS
jgi:surface protein